MNILTNGYFQDGLKAIIYLIPVIYIAAKKKEFKLKYFWLLFLGLAILFFGHFMDLLDEFEGLRNIFDVERFFPIQDFLEDMIGFTLGFFLVLLAVYLEFRNKNKTLGGG